MQSVFFSSKRNKLKQTTTNLHAEGGGRGGKGWWLPPPLTSNAFVSQLVDFRKFTPFDIFFMSPDPSPPSAPPPPPSPNHFAFFNDKFLV